MTADDLKRIFLGPTLFRLDTHAVAAAGAGALR